MNIFDHSRMEGRQPVGGAQAEDLLVMAQRIRGAAEAQAFFQQAAAAQGKTGYLPDVTPDFLAAVERELAGSVGAATAHAMVGQITQGHQISVEDLLAVADETAQILEYSNQLEAKSAELEMTARALREANEKLTALSVQKDSFLSQISHELRTPMTSIRSFSEILQEGDLTPDRQAHYAAIIDGEAQRLTRLLDALLDLSFLESGRVEMARQTGLLSDVIDRAIVAGTGGKALDIRSFSTEGWRLTTDLDRLCQVFINLIANACKYCEAPDPTLSITAAAAPDGGLLIDFVDNGRGIPPDAQMLIFEKFSRLGDQAKAGSAGLGLAICREILQRLGGNIDYLSGQTGAAFRVVLPKAAVVSGPVRQVS